MGVAARALDPEALALHRREMRAARDEGDVGARLRQRRAESPSDAARANDCDPHELFLPLDNRGHQDAAAPTGEHRRAGGLDAQAMIGRHVAVGNPGGVSRCVGEVKSPAKLQ